MAMHLFEHNQTAYKAAVAMLSTHGKAAVIHPTGTGKSFIGFKFCEDNPDETICWLSPSRYIYQTQLENLAETSDGYQPENVKFYTYAKLMLLSDDEIAGIQPDFIILDEFHRCGAELWGAGVDKLLKAYPDAPILGLSATAIRYLDNQRDMSDELFDANIASEMTLGEAIVRGILNPPKYILTVFSYQKEFEEYEKRIQRSKYKKIRDEATAYLEALRRTLDKAEKLDVIFDKHMDDRTGKYIVFCANADHMNDMIARSKEWFSRIDKKPHIYRAYSSDPDTSKDFADFKADTSEHLKLLYCIDMLNEGVHVDDISGVILLRPTVSPIIYKQQIGRALSASKSRNPIIFDIVNNIENLYNIDGVAEEMKVAIRYYRSHDGEGYVVNDNFELIDKVADCKALFEQLEGTLSASWDVMYGKAKAYFEQYGTLEIPKDYFTEDGFSLGIWVNTQRQIYRGTLTNAKPLTQVQIDKLTAIGMRWENLNDISWDKYYEAAKHYVEEHGDLLAPVTYVDANGIKLGDWLNTQRTNRKSGIRQGSMSQERIDKLDALGMVWDVLDYLWEENFAVALQYHKTHGNLDVPTQYVDSNGVHLGAWLTSMRQSRKKGKSTLSLEQIARLDALGMIWEDRIDKQWNDAFEALCDYYAEKHTFHIPSKYVTRNGIKLYAWANLQRAKFRNGTLSPERTEKLKNIGFPFETGLNWNDRFQLVKAYYEEHGNLDIPSDYTIQGCNLRHWLLRQKQNAEGTRASGMTQEQIEMLRSIGLFEVMSPIDKKWTTHYEQAKAYFAAHGSLLIPKEYVIDGFHLGVWITLQKKRYRKGELSQEQIVLLNKIGMEWDNLSEKSNAALYEIGFQHLEQFIAEYGLAQLRASTVCDDGYQLGAWCFNCRSKYKSGKLAKQYVERFMKLHFALDDAQEWDYKFQQVKAYFEEHEVVTLPEGLLAEDGKSLSFWLAKQRRAYPKGQLTEEQMRKLDEIGYPFKNDAGHQQYFDSRWLECFERLRTFIQDHGRMPVFSKENSDERLIRTWVKNQQIRYQQGKLSERQAGMLTNIGVSLPMSAQG